MNVLVGKILHVELFAGCSDVAVLIPVSLLVPIHTRQQDVCADIEFSLLVEEGHYVLLQDVSPWSAQFVDFVLPNNLLNLFEAFDDLNPCSSVSVLARFDKPGIPFLGPEAIFELLALLFLLLFLNSLSSPLVLLIEETKLFALEISDVVGHRNVLERIGVLSLVVGLYVHK